MGQRTMQENCTGLIRKENRLVMFSVLDFEPEINKSFESQNIFNLVLPV